MRVSSSTTEKLPASPSASSVARVTWNSTSGQCIPFAPRAATGAVTITRSPATAGVPSAARPPNASFAVHTSA